MKEKFREARLSLANRMKLNLINSIIIEYQKQGYKLTLRQLYYQLVSRDVIPNTVAEYAKVSKLLTEGRMGGIVDWSAIEDRLRSPKSPAAWDSPLDILDACAKQFALHRMKGQKTYMECWVEKDALSGVLSRVTEKYHVPILVNRGYGSVSSMYDSYKRFVRAYQDGADQVKIIYLGDYDPSGIDMIRDINDRILEFLQNSEDIRYEFDRDTSQLAEDLLREYDAQGLEEGDLIRELASADWIKTKFSIEPIALTLAQIKQYNPPPNPAKITDPRAKEFIKTKGATSWEVDALKPQVLNGILTAAIEKHIDKPLWDSIVDKETNYRHQLEELKDHLEIEE